MSQIIVAVQYNLPVNKYYFRLKGVVNMQILEGIIFLLTIMIFGFLIFTKTIKKQYNTATETTTSKR